MNFPFDLQACDVVIYLLVSKIALTSICKEAFHWGAIDVQRQKRDIEAVRRVAQLVRNCTIFLCPLNVGSIGDQWRGPSKNEKDLNDVTSCNCT